MTPRLACQPFAVLADVLTAQCGCSFTEADDGPLLTEMIDEASDMLYVLSGGRVTGRCTTTVWPVTNRNCWPTGLSAVEDQRAAWLGDAIPLPGEDIDVTEVKIDGVVIPNTDYFLIDRKWLRRRSTTWPTENDITKTPGAVGTWTISYEWGRTIREIARRAAVELTCQLARSTQSISRLRGVVSANVQGVSVQMDPEEVAQLGLPEVSRFLDFHSPRGIGALGVWSPDLANGWRLIQVTATP